MLDAHVKTSWWVLRLCYGLVPIVAGFDKFTNLLTNWTKYLSPTIQQMLPASMSAQSFMHWVGVIEIAAGLMVLSHFVRWGAYVVSLWLVGIAINLLSTGQFFDIAVRDL
ncbi:MAG TPA: DoxX family membrane protein, partial [Polyangiaceae bacterium]|nr:DoxX family membrane protein [Polyangiaceae bacterium]